MKIHDRVIATRDIWEEANEYGPARLLAAKGDTLVVRRICNLPWDAAVSHEHITDNSFGVRADEVREVPS